VSDSYLGRFRAYGDQRRLFPHRRPLRLTLRAQVLDGRRRRRAGARLTFTDGYRRSQAAGIGGDNASFGVFTGLGEPLVPGLHDERACLLTGFGWFTGINQAGRRADPGATDRRQRRRLPLFASPCTPARRCAARRRGDDDAR
jgi:hypothetical protein